jgi:hypothetical protein
MDSNVERFDVSFQEEEDDAERHTAEGLRCNSAG